MTGNSVSIPVTGVSVNKSSTYLAFTSSEQLIASCEPTNASNQDMIWESSNESAAIVDSDGLVTGVSKGETVITVRTVDGDFSDSCTVIVFEAGVLDTSFNSVGYVVHQNASGGFDSMDLGHSVTEDNNGKIVVTGYSQGSGSMYLVVWRYNVDGTLDTSFNSQGYVVYNSGNDDRGRNLIVNGSGNIFVTGGSWDQYDMKVWKFTSSGVLDTVNFNPPNGYVMFDSGDQEDGRGISLDVNGNIVVCGYNRINDPFDMALWRYSDSGVLDTTNFNSPDGYVFFDGGDADVGYDVVTDASGNIYVAGYILSDSEANVAIWKYTSSGSLDTANFNSPNGYVIFDGAGGAEYNGNSIALDANGKILIAGGKYESSELKCAIYRFDSDGTLDTTFNSPHGYVGFEDEQGEAYALDIDESGNILVADIFGKILRYTSLGHLDTQNFNPPYGYVNLDSASTNAELYDIHVDGNGMISVTGSWAEGINTGMAVWRFHN